MIEACLASGLSLGAFSEEHLIGYRLTYLPGLGEENLGRQMGMSDAELLTVAQFYGTLIAPAWRGQGLGGRLVHENLALLAGRGLSCALVTVHPHNLKSITMFQHGNAFQIMGEITFYGGLPRLLLKKSLYK